MNINQLESSLLKNISLIISRDIENEIIKHITIIEVKTSKDLDVAKVYFTLYDSEINLETVNNSLKTASGFIRKELTKYLKIRKIPKLLFKYDDSKDKANRIQELIKKVNK